MRWPCDDHSPRSRQRSFRTRILLCRCTSGPWACNSASSAASITRNHVCSSKACARRDLASRAPCASPCACAEVCASASQRRLRLRGAPGGVARRAPHPRLRRRRVPWAAALRVLGLAEGLRRRRRPLPPLRHGVLKRQRPEPAVQRSVTVLALVVGGRSAASRSLLRAKCSRREGLERSSGSSGADCPRDAHELERVVGVAGCCVSDTQG